MFLTILLFVTVVSRARIPALGWLVAWLPNGKVMTQAESLGLTSASVQVLSAASAVFDMVYSCMKLFNKSPAYIWARVWAHEKEKLRAAMGLLYLWK